MKKRDFEPLDIINRPPKRPIVLYDGSCNFCCQGAVLARRFHNKSGIKFYPNNKRGLRGRFPDLDWSLVEEQMLLILPDGRVFGGEKGISMILEDMTSKPVNLIGWLMKKPGFAKASNIGYRTFGKYRIYFNNLIPRARSK